MTTQTTPPAFTALLDEAFADKRLAYHHSAPESFAVVEARWHEHSRAKAIRSFNSFLNSVVGNAGDVDIDADDFNALLTMTTYSYIRKVMEKEVDGAVRLLEQISINQHALNHDIGLDDELVRGQKRDSAELHHKNNRSDHIECVRKTIEGSTAFQSS